jgi:molybdopterin converting factor small subunit
VDVKVTFEFSGNLVDIIGRQTVSVNFGAKCATLDEALKNMVNSFSQMHERLAQTGILVNGEIKAMFVLDNNLIQKENVIPDNSVIRVLPQICGG